MRDLSLAQIMIAKESGAKAFDEYAKVMFPWIETSKKRDGDQTKDLLQKIVKAGPLTVRPMQEQKVKSRLVQKREMKGPMTDEQRKKQNELYSKLGKSIPI